MKVALTIGHQKVKTANKRVKTEQNILLSINRLKQTNFDYWTLKGRKYVNFTILDDYQSRKFVNQ